MNTILAATTAMLVLAGTGISAASPRIVLSPIR